MHAKPRKEPRTARLQKKKELEGLSGAPNPQVKGRRGEESRGKEGKVGPAREVWQLCGQCHVDRRATPAPQVPDGQLQDGASRARGGAVGPRPGPGTGG